MKHEIEIWNGSGWNNYQALRELKRLPVGTRGLLSANKVVRLTVSPYDSERPYGIAARFYDRDGEQLFCLAFDQNDSGHWIGERIYALLEEGINHRIVANAAKRAAEKLAAAKAAGFETAEAHAAHLAEIAERARKERAAKIEAANATDEAAADRMFESLVAALRQYPGATRLTRSGKLVRDLSLNAVEQFGDATFAPGQIKAWLRKNGFRNSVDDRNHLVAAAKAHAARLQP
jgi:hypothetical protein